MLLVEFAFPIRAVVRGSGAATAWLLLRERGAGCLQGGDGVSRRSSFSRC